MIVMVMMNTMTNMIQTINSNNDRNVNDFKTGKENVVLLINYNFYTYFAAHLTRANYILLLL